LVKDIADAYGGELVWTKVGSVTVSQTMKKLNAKLGGEENGGIFYGPHQSVRELPQYFIEKAKVECPEAFKAKALEKLLEQVRSLNISTVDGVKIWFKDKSAILIRPSGTEPIYRLYAEAKTQKKAIQLVDEYRLKLKKVIENLNA
jgi:phosphomannomutase/phosphoglucomutase